MEQNDYYYTPSEFRGQLLLQQQYVNHVNPPAPQIQAMSSANAAEFSYSGAKPAISLAKPKRKQVKNACVNCQKACKKCDDGRPCQRCIKYNLADTCKNSVRKERKKGAKRGPYKRKSEEKWTPSKETRHKEDGNSLAAIQSQIESAKTTAQSLLVLPSNHTMKNVSQPSSSTNSDLMSPFPHVAYNANSSKFNQFPTSAPSVATQRPYPVGYSNDNSYNNMMPSPISNHNDINLGMNILANRPSPPRHSSQFISQEEHGFKNMYPLSFNNNNDSTTLQHQVNDVMVYGTPTGSPLLSSNNPSQYCENTAHHEPVPSWSSLAAGGTFQYIPQTNSHAHQ